MNLFDDDKIKDLIDRLIKQFFENDGYKNNNTFYADFTRKQFGKDLNLKDYIDELIGKGYVYDRIPVYRKPTAKRTAIEYPLYPVSTVKYDFNNFYVLEIQAGLNRDELTVQIANKTVQLTGNSHTLKLSVRHTIHLESQVYTKPLDSSWKENSVLRLVLRKKNKVE